MSTNQDIMKAIKDLTAAVARLSAKVDESELANRTMVEMRWSEISQKIDIFTNLSEQSAQHLAEAGAAGATVRKTKANRPVAFKKLFLEDREKYMNQLYTQAEIDLFMQHEDVVKKTKAQDKYSKIAALIYNNHIKTDTPAGRNSAFESVYSNI